MSTKKETPETPNPEQQDNNLTNTEQNDPQVPGSPDTTDQEPEVKVATLGMKPSIGRTVHFKTEEGEVLAAVIVGVNDSSTVNLQAFTNNEFSPPLVLIKNVKHGDEAKQWSWPPRVEE